MPDFMASTNSIYHNYFTNRGVDSSTYQSYKIPTYLQQILPLNKEASILDIGCGFGQMLFALKKQGYTSLNGLELLPEAAAYCKEQLNLSVEQGRDIELYASRHHDRFDLIIMSHVLEHLTKESIIDVLKSISQMLRTDGVLVLMVPNGQSPNHSYWMWEDFTHHTLFTAGSLLYVLKSAGFSKIEFLDPNDLLDKPPLKRLFKQFFQYLYRLNQRFWNSVNSSGYHYASPVIYTWELKIKATK
ncbi:MAG: class I SAM-dependent methyltransferase [Bacteroidota bacterium]|jgi:SAM-dependent methyltransferase